MRGLNEDEVCDFVAMTEDKVSFTEESAYIYHDLKDLQYCGRMSAHGYEV